MKYSQGIQEFSSWFPDFINKKHDKLILTKITNERDEIKKLVEKVTKTTEVQTDTTLSEMENVEVMFG